MWRKKRTEFFAGTLAVVSVFAGICLTTTVTAHAQVINGGKPVTPEELRPPANMLVDCAKAPRGAITKLSADLARWATIYCTRNSAIFNSTDKYFGVFPDSGLRASFDAASIDNKAADAGGESYFKAISYTPYSDAEMTRLTEIDPLSAKIINGKKAQKLILTTSSDNTIAFLVIDPAADPFWVFPLTDKGLGTPAFFVISVATLNQVRR